MTVEYDTFLQPKADRIVRDVEMSSVIATLKGDDPKRGGMSRQGTPVRVDFGVGPASATRCRNGPCPSRPPRCPMG